MLTADLAQSWQRGEKVRPFYIPRDEPGYLRDAEHLIELFGEHEGLVRHELDEALQEYVGTGTDYKILRGFIKLLMDRCEFETASAKDPVEIRRALFLKARDAHPISRDESLRWQVIEETARELGCSPEAVGEGLFADLPENQRLVHFERLAAPELLDLYNLAQAQALLYRCLEMRLFVEPQSAESYRELFGAIKAYRLIHKIKGNPKAGYEIRLDGPVSMFHRSQKYGIQMAVFLPALLLCKGWRMRAEIAPQSKNNRGKAYFELDSRQKQLRSHYLNTSLSENFVAEKLLNDWGKLESEWQLELSSEVIDLGESAFIPDFVLRHDDGRKFYLEILGFWTPEHLQRRLSEFAHARVENFVVAAWEELRGSRDPVSRVPPHTIIFKTSLSPVMVESAINELSSRGLE
jgi:predicted nuclease of restriction endonuclease-like RecB superfamily